MSITLASDALAPGRPIPTRFTGDGGDVSPPLNWSGVPESTRQFALVMDDPDAPTPQPWVHWVLYALPGEVRQLPQGVPARDDLSDPPGAKQGKNSWGTIGYRGPAPPRGHGVHRYHFTLYALDEALSLAAGLDKAALLQAIQGHVLARTELVGTYERR